MLAILLLAILLQSSGGKVLVMFDNVCHLYIVSTFILQTIIIYMTSYMQRKKGSESELGYDAWLAKLA